METQGFGERVKRTSKRIMKIILISLLIIGDGRIQFYVLGHL